MTPEGFVMENSLELETTLMYPGINTNEDPSSVAVVDLKSPLFGASSEALQHQLPLYRPDCNEHKASTRLKIYFLQFGLSYTEKRLGIVKKNIKSKFPFLTPTTEISGELCLFVFVHCGGW